MVAGEQHDLLVACEVGLLAEAAADVAHLHPDPALGHAGDAAGDGAHVVRRLGGDAHVERAGVRLPRGHDPAGLHRHREVAVLHVRARSPRAEPTRRSRAARRRAASASRPRRCCRYPDARAPSSRAPSCSRRPEEAARASSSISSSASSASARLSATTSAYGSPT